MTQAVQMAGHQLIFNKFDLFAKMTVYSQAGSVPKLIFKHFDLIKCVDKNLCLSQAMDTSWELPKV